MKKFMSFLAAAGMAVAPVAVSAQNAGALSLASASAPTSSGLSYFQGDESESGGGSTAVILGVVLVVLIGVAAISGNNHTLNNPQSP